MIDDRLDPSLTVGAQPSELLQDSRLLGNPHTPAWTWGPFAPGKATLGGNRNLFRRNIQNG